jgi:small subunit ribosomal protein S2
MEKLELRFGGMRNMSRLPDLVFVVDVRREETAVKEANILHIPVIALVDTNCDPDPVDFVIPANDDAIRAIKLLTAKMADAVLEGVAMRKARSEEEEFEAEEVDFAEAMADVDDDEAYLGESTLAKLRSGDLAFLDEEADEDEDDESENDESENEDSENDEESEDEE